MARSTTPEWGIWILYIFPKALPFEKGKWKEILELIHRSS